MNVRHWVILRCYPSPGWSRECLTEWGAFMSLAIPGMLMLCVEWWTYEIGSFLAGRRAPLGQGPRVETGTVAACPHVITH